MITNGDPKGQIFLSYPLTNNAFFFLLTTVENKLPEVPEYAKMQFHVKLHLSVFRDVKLHLSVFRDFWKLIFNSGEQEKECIIRERVG